MIYSPGIKHDYSCWIRGKNSNWCWKKLKRHLDEPPLHTSTPYISDVTKVFMNGADKLKQGEFRQLKGFVWEGKRDSTFRSYLEPACHRTNLHILTRATVIKVISTLHSRKIIGVKLRTRHRELRVKSNIEVILTAGVVGSTKLLLLSGIGPEKDLKHLDIPFVTDLPVGRNIIDHITFFGMSYLTNMSLPFKDKKLSTSIAGFESVGFLHINQSKKEPDFELLAANILENKMPWQFGKVQQQYYDKYFREVENKVSMTVFPVLLQPKSRGNIKLRSSNYLESPKINPRYLAEEEDVERMAKALQIIEKIMYPQNVSNSLWFYFFFKPVIAVELRPVPGTTLREYEI